MYSNPCRKGIIKTSDSLTNLSETTKGENYFEQTSKTCSGGQDRRSFPSTEFGRRSKSGCNILFFPRKLTNNNINLDLKIYLSRKK